MKNLNVIFGIIKWPKGFQKTLDKCKKIKIIREMGRKSVLWNIWGVQVCKWESSDMYCFGKERLKILAETKIVKSKLEEADEHNFLFN